MVEYHPISIRDQSGLHQFGKKVSLGIFLGYELIAGETLERRFSDCGFGRFGKVGRISQKGDEFIFPVADGTAKLSGRYYEFRKPTPRREQTARSEDCSGELEEGEPPTESTDDAEARADFWPMTSSIVIIMNLEIHSMCRGKKHSLFHYIDVPRSAHTDLDVMQEKRVDDCLNVESNRSLSDSWKGFTKFTLLSEKPPKGYMWSGGETDKSANDYQTRLCMARSMDENR